MSRPVDRPTAGRRSARPGWLAGRLTPAERTALGALCAAWLTGAALQASGLDERLARGLAARLHPPLPSPDALAAELEPGDPRALWYAAGFALAAELAAAGDRPEPLDPATADRAAWDRLPGIGPRTAQAIVEHRDREGPFRGPDDLLEVRGIGPVTMERLRPWLAWGLGPQAAVRPAAPSARPDLNRVDAAFLAGLPNIGPQLARRILDERTAQRGFRDWSDLLAVEGVGPVRMRVLQNATRLASLPQAGSGRNP